VVGFGVEVFVGVGFGVEVAVCVGADVAVAVVVGVAVIVGVGVEKSTLIVKLTGSCLSELEVPPEAVYLLILSKYSPGPGYSDELGLPILPFRVAEAVLSELIITGK
jgi:hypothetical protein